MSGSPVHRRNSLAYNPHSHFQRRRSSSIFRPTRANSAALNDMDNSTASLVAPEVEMASEEIFSGPLGESFATSVSSFAHQGARGQQEREDSMTNFQYYDQDQEDNEEESQNHDKDMDIRGSFDGNGTLVESPNNVWTRNGHLEGRNHDDADEEAVLDTEIDNSSIHGSQTSFRQARSPMSSMSSGRSQKRNRRDSRRSFTLPSRQNTMDSENYLLRRFSFSSSTSSITSGPRDRHGRYSGRTNQRIYIHNEDLTIVIAGFQTSKPGAVIYAIICIMTLGFGYLILRWLPTWRVWLVGSPKSFREASWVAVENQWGEMNTHDLCTQKYGRPLSSVFGYREKSTGRPYDEGRDPIIHFLKSVDYRYMRFFYNPKLDKFFTGTWNDPTWAEIASVKNGLESNERDCRAVLFGKNLIDIEEKSYMQLLFDEVLHPFYIFQIASITLWALDSYKYYATCIFVISLISISTTLIETKATMKKMKEVSHSEYDVRVLRNGFWRSVESSNLVPGDIYEVSDPALVQVPCDSLLLSGDCVVNESMLTGESMPVSKLPATNGTLLLLPALESKTVHPELKKHLIYCGTKIIRARRPQHTQGDDGNDSVALGLVVRTGFNTTKGALIRSMLFPKPSGFKFYRDSFKYILVMGMVALVGFFASFANFLRFGLSWRLIVVRALDLITIVVPPALPATLAIGTSFALQRLKAHKIFCISPQRVNVGGQLNVFCFDKTGTLTEEDLDVLGVHVVQQGKFGNLMSEPMSILPRSPYERDPTINCNLNRTILYIMATCHSLNSVDQKLIGDPLDIKMFDFTGWSYQEGSQPQNDDLEADEDVESSTRLTPSIARPPSYMNFELDTSVALSTNRSPIELGILKQFEFVSHLRRASVLVRQLGATTGHVFVKGAPECMQEICRPESFPSDYEQVLSYYTHRGFRVIGCAAKSIPKLNWAKIQRMTREQAESNLDFVGFIIFENKLKPITTSVIGELTRANIRCVMCTGDNILTAISVARECELISAAEHCFVPHFVEGDSQTKLSKLVWQSVDDPALELGEATLKPMLPLPSFSASSTSLATSASSNAMEQEEHDSLLYDVNNLRNYSLAVSGDVFRWIVDYGAERVLQQMLVRGQVFARMSPDEKHELVDKLQSIDYSCGFCGDGANDCGALKAADVGISLSEAEASVAAPFTSRVFDISCVPQVIREGRASLVTSFSCFKFMSLYSAIQFTTVSFLYAWAATLGDFQFLYIDMFLALPIGIFIGWAGPFPRLSTRRPTASLVSRKVLIPLLGQLALCIGAHALVCTAVRRQTWYVPPPLPIGDDTQSMSKRSSLNTALFLASCWLYIIMAAVLSVVDDSVSGAGKRNRKSSSSSVQNQNLPFRQPITRNMPLLITLISAVALTLYLMLDPSPWVQQVMDLTYMSSGFKLFVLGVCAVGGGLVAWVGERWLFPAVARWVGKIVKRRRNAGEKQRKLYTVILEER